MALTKAQISLVTVSTLGVAAGGYTAQLAAFNSQKEAAAFIQAEGLLNGGTNAEFVNTVAGNLNNLATAQQKAAFLKALDDGASRSDATVDFANTLLVSNGSIANVNKAIASTSTSTDLNALKAEITPVDSAQIVTFNTASSTGFAQKDLQANLGKAEIESGAGKISADFTFNLKNQANVFTDGPVLTGGVPTSTVGEFTGAFLSPMLERAAAVQSDSAIYVKLLDGFALRDNFQSIERLATNGIGFSIDGVAVVVADKPEDGDQGAIYKAKNYVELKDAITARLAELASGQGLPAGADAATYAKLATFTVELGENFTKANQAGDPVTGTELVIKDSAGSTLVPQGFSTYGGIHPHTDLNAINELTNQAPSTSTQLISTNINAENVGYGSQGATLNVAGQSASKKGVEEFKVTATKDVWFTRLESRDTESNQHLQEVLLQTGSNGYFRVGTQDKGASLVALVDQNFGVKGGGLVDVLKLDAAAASSTAVNAFISDKVIARNYNLKDTDNNYKTEDVQVSYNLTGGNDVLQLAVASEVLAYADTQVNIVAGGGNDTVHLKVVGNELAVGDKVANAGAGTYGKGWLANQQLNDNVKIDAAAGDNTIWTEGSGNVRITTGGGNDTIYADNSGRTTLADPGAKAKLAALDMGADVNALYVLNARSADIGDILSNTANATDGVTNVDQEFKTFKSTVSVKFKGFESKYVEIASTNYVTNTQQINQAIKKAILEDATLNKLLTVKEFPGNVLVVESLIDGTQALTDLSFDFVSPTATAPVAPATLAAGQLLITAADLTAAAKAYDPAGTVTPTVVADTALDVETAIQTTYNLNGTGQPLQFAKDGAATGTAEVQEIDFSGVTTLGTTEGGTIQVGSVNIALEAGDDAATVANKVAAQLNGKMQNADLGVALVAPATDAAVTATASAGKVTITYASTAGDVALVATPATAAVTITAPTAAQLTAATATTGEVTHIANAALLAMATSVTKGSALAVIATEEIVINATDTAAEVGAKLATALNGKNAADLGLTYTTASTVTVTYDATDGLVITHATVNEDATTLAAVTVNAPAVTGTPATDIAVTPTQETAGVAGTAAADVDGTASTAHSDNVINAGGGNDVIVLGTGADSNDTVVLSGTFGKTTIVNFDSTVGATDAAGNGGDLLDFRTYLDANYGAAGQANVSLVTSASTLAANTVSVIDFSSLQGSATAGGTSTTVIGIKGTDALSSVTASQLTAELNADFSAGTTAATKHVFLIHNKNTTTTLDNAGEYLVVTANSTAADAKLAGVTIVGTLDFGTDAAGASNLAALSLSNLVDFA